MPRGRGWFGYGRGGGWGRGRGWGIGNPYPFCRNYPWLPRRWWAGACPSGYGDLGPYMRAPAYYMMPYPRQLW